MDETLRAISCPCCRRLLCALELDGKAKRWKFTADSPELKHDASGLFMKCGKCGRRVNFVSTLSSAMPFELAALQECGQL